MKNFKKVISAVIALAMSVSSFAAVNAATFSDVADTASYAEAVNVLSALGIITGYEDGTFKPEGTITRAETATMIVGALNMTEDAKASAGTSQFADVNTSAAWAQGYINVGVAQGFIKGMDANTFAPQDNVTYAQMCVMLTTIAGYGEYAAANNANSSDWSYGYTSMAASTGINKGVSVSKDTNLTRGQVAQMIYNTLTTPKLGVAEYNLTGNTYSQLDGKSGRDFKTLLSEKFDGYVVTATINDTPVSAPTALDNDQVDITVTKADWFEDATTAADAGNSWKNLKIYFASDVDVVNNLFQSGKAILIDDEELDEYNMVYFAPNTKTETKEFDAADYVGVDDLARANYYSATGKIRFDSKYYTMNDTVTLYVNGVACVEDFDKNTADIDNTLNTYLGNARGTIKMLKGTDDKGYSSIFVDCYEIAKVTGVTYKNSQTTVNFVTKTSLTNNSNKLVIDDDQVTDGDVVISVSKGDAEVELKSLAKDDIIAFATDFATVRNSGKTITNPKNITVLATNETVSGKVTGKDDDEKTFSVDGKAYECVKYNAGDFNVKDSYTFTLDPFGRIYSAEEDASSKNYAIAEKWLDGSEKVQLVLADGTKKEYELESNLSVDDINTIIYGNAAGTGAKKAPKDRVVEYTVKNSTGALSAISAVTPKYSYGEGDGVEYKARTEKLGSASINSATKIIDATDYSGKYSDYVSFATTSLKDGTEYEGYVYQTGTYAGFVLLTKIGTVFTDSSRFAVVRKAPQQDTHNDDDCYRVNVLYNGEETDVYLAYDATLANKLAQGDAFYFETDSDGFIDHVYVVYKAATKTFNNFAAAGVDTSKYKTDRDGWRFTFYDGGNDIALVYGIVTETKNNGVEFGIINGNKINTNIDDDATDSQGVYNFAIASDAQTYIYDIGDTTTVKEYDKISTGSVIASNLDAYELSGDDDGIFDVSSADAQAALNYAVAMIVDGSIVEIYEITK